MQHAVSHQSPVKQKPCLCASCQAGLVAVHYWHLSEILLCLTTNSKLLQVFIPYKSTSTCQMSVEHPCIVRRLHVQRKTQEELEVMHYANQVASAGHVQVRLAHHIS